MSIKRILDIDSETESNGLSKRPKIQMAEQKSEKSEKVGTQVESDPIKELNKIQQKKEDAAEAMKLRCKICFKEIAPILRCFGHGGGGGGSNGGGDNSTGSNNSDDKTNTTANILSQMDSKQLVADTITVANLTLQPQPSDTEFDQEVISELLTKKLLVIDNNREQGILTIQLQYDIELLSTLERKEFEKYINVIRNELDKFKSENGITAECTKMEEDNDGNIVSLRIMLSTLYDAFIQQLAQKDLLPLVNIEQQPNENVEYQANTNHFTGKPLSLKPTRKRKADDEEKEEENEYERDSKRQKKSQQESTFIHPKSLLDGLKPEGY